jgi:hypothetical protein
MGPIVAELEAISRRTAAEYPRMIVAADQLGRRGWTVPMWSTPRLVVEWAENLSADELDAYFAAHYRGPRSKASAALQRRVESSALLEPWRPVIAQAATAYRRRLCLVVVPTLLPVLEGAIAAAAGQFERTPDPRRHSRTLLASKNEGVGRLVLTSVTGFVDAVYASMSFAASHPERLNRHWVLHGRSGNWTDIDALRLFHALDSVAEVAQRGQLLNDG